MALEMSKAKTSDAVTPARHPPSERKDYQHFYPVQTRWADNDFYGHVNNSVYYFYVDTVINRFLIGPGGLDIRSSPVIAIVAETLCRFHRSFAYPDDIEAGLRVGHLGTRSVRYEVGLFAPGEPLSRADAHLVHVYVDRASMRPVAAIPAGMRAALETLRGG
jgi:acyl-CoA thioester hydrolase